MKTVNRSSGIKGVTIKVMNNGKHKYWCARVQGKLRIRKYFPFTEQGKKEAAEFYQRIIEENKNNYYQYRERKIKLIK